jgi:prephenate dehydratase
VAEIHNLLPRTNLYIVGEYFLRIEHHLLGVKGASIDDVKEVHSHPQAIMQCHDALLDRKFQTVSAPNTAIAASQVAKGGDSSKAAVGSKLAAELYGLDVLAENIEDADDNMTVFIAMSREPFDPEQEKGRVITSVLFTARNIPAALYKALGGFATNQVNLLKVESYIPSSKSTTAQFFITFEGHPDQKKVQLALEELGFFCRKLKVLGVYYADEKRYI